MPSRSKQFKPCSPSPPIRRQAMRPEASMIRKTCFTDPGTVSTKGFMATPNTIGLSERTVALPTMLLGYSLAFPCASIKRFHPAGPHVAVLHL